MLRTVLTVFAVLIGACSGTQSHREHADDRAKMPASPAALVQLADQLYGTSRKTKAMKRAAHALQTADQLAPNQFKTLWRLARIYSALARYDKDHGEAWAEQGRVAAQKAQALQPQRIEGPIFLAICTGVLAKYRLSDAEALSKAVLTAAKQAAAINPNYSAGLPRRVMGAVYLYAPAWPSGVGDLDEAFEILEALVKDHPAPSNMFYLAEAYRRTDQIGQAVALYKKMLKFKPRGEWRLEGPRFRAQAREHLKRLKD